MKRFFTLIFSVEDKSLERIVFGLRFPNPVGLAAGFDKNAVYLEELSCLGFGFIEIGTVTPLPQPGNDKPRLFRLSKDRALINRMGFNNDGAITVAERLKEWKKKQNPILIGGNIGKNKITPNENAVDDYVRCFDVLFDYIDYFVVNVSSPNTPGLRELQDKEPLLNILNTLQVRNNIKPRRKPILLKIAPDLHESQLNDIIKIVHESKIDGIVATNTTISRENLKTDNKNIEAIGAGGLSGSPINTKSTAVIKYLCAKTQNPIIGVGGVMNSEDADRKIQAGATLIQVYTGFIYEGPGIVKSILKNL